jgi:hypothetical protein
MNTPLDNLSERLSVRPLITTLGRKLKLLQRHDHKQWWSLDEMRFCARCEHLFLGREIRFLEDDDGGVAFRCPTYECGGTLPDWEYPELHL